jgi:hypothetical protein
VEQRRRRQRQPALGLAPRPCRRHLQLMALGAGAAGL